MKRTEGNKTYLHYGQKPATSLGHQGCEEFSERGAIFLNYAQ